MAPMISFEEAKDESTDNSPITLHGFQLAALFRCRPELAEMVFLEIRAMKNASGNSNAAAAPISDLTHL